jgi:hypothetical protein
MPRLLEGSIINFIEPEFYWDTLGGDHFLHVIGSFVSL